MFMMLHYACMFCEQVFGTKVCDLIFIYDAHSILWLDISLMMHIAWLDISPDHVMMHIASLIFCLYIYISKSTTLFFFFPLLIRYKKDQDISFLATCSLHNLLNASVLSDSGPPLLDFEVKLLYAVLFIYSQFIGYKVLESCCGCGVLAFGV